MEILQIKARPPVELCLAEFLARFGMQPRLFRQFSGLPLSLLPKCIQGLVVQGRQQTGQQPGHAGPFGDPERLALFIKEARDRDKNGRFAESGSRWQLGLSNPADQGLYFELHFYGDSKRWSIRLG